MPCIQRLRPHPVLDQLKIDYGAFAERGEVYFQAVSRETTVNVSTIFSSAQLNAVAACIFLSLNLTQRGSALDLLRLDDPIQNMDDFNVLGLLDLLRGFVKERQVFIATHDIELGSLIQRKLRPLIDGHRTITHDFVSYDRSGPQIRTSIDQYEPQPQVLEAVAG
jgi:DNA repair protein SbcC/Rad50